jgi:hypothetical protein
MIRLVSETYVRRIAVGIRINRHRANAQFMAGAQNTHRYFAPVGNQYFVESSGV